MNYIWYIFSKLDHELHKNDDNYILYLGSHVLEYSYLTAWYYINEIYPKGCSVYEECLYTISFKISYDVVNIEVLFKKLEQAKERLYIENWGISQINLEDIFIKLIKKDF